MTAFVLDNSVTMRWCFESTSTPYAEEVLQRLQAGQIAHVPVMWLYEVVSVLAKAERRGWITAEKVRGFLEDLRSLNIRVDEESAGHILRDLHPSRRPRIERYDAAYLELAIRKGLPLATLDEDLQKAARKVSLKCFNQRRSS